MDRAVYIKSQIQMVDILEKYGVGMDRKGFINCPFHEDSTASLKVYKNSFYCFGCNVGGDIIKFVSLYFGLNFSDAIKKIDNDFGLNVFNSMTLSQYRKIKESNKKIQDKRKREELERQYNQCAWNECVTYYKWLKTLPQSKARDHDIAYMERLLDQILDPDVIVPFNVFALIPALKTKFEEVLD